MFKVGDVVTLRSGSPKMTVCIVDGERKTVWVQWFVDGKIERGEFVFDTLQKTGECERPVY